MVRFQITLDEKEAEILATWARTELRDPRDQIRYILIQEMNRRGLMLLEDKPNDHQSSKLIKDTNEQ
jgi:hypothetical protein